MKVLRIIGTVLAAGILAVLSLYFTLPNVAPPAQLALLSLLPGGSSASARAAMAQVRLAADSADPRRAAAERLAKAALRQEPSNVAAIRALAGVYAARGDEEQAARLLNYGETMTRRDALTNLALGELAAKRADAAGTVRYYGRVVATSQLFGDTAGDRLMVASNDPAVARALGRALRRDPPWEGRFMSRFVRSTETARGLFATLAAIASPEATPDERTYLGFGFRTLLKAGLTEEAAVLYRRVHDGAGPLLRDADFEAQVSDPFGWQLVSEGALSALEAPVEGGRGRRLDVVADAGQAGVVGDQILALTPGRYRLSAAMGSDAARSLEWPAVTVACTDAKTLLVSYSRQRAGDMHPSSQEFSVPQSCPLQVLSIVFGAAFDASRSEGWVDDIGIERADKLPGERHPGSE